MKRFTCICCESSHGIGYLFDNLEIRICRICRDVVLSYLDHIGIVMTDEHILIRELCESSHYVPDAIWSFHNYTTAKIQYVIRLRKSVDNF